MNSNSQNDIKRRADRLEQIICEYFELTNDEYLLLWHELGCQYVESLFKKIGFIGSAYKMAVRTYQSSGVFWLFWLGQWMTTCEWFLYWNYSKKSIDDFIKMQLQAQKPTKKIHFKIITDGNKGNRHSIPMRSA